MKKSKFQSFFLPNNGGNQNIEIRVAKKDEKEA